MSIIKTRIPTKQGEIAAVINHAKGSSNKLAILCSGFLDSKDYKHLEGLAKVLSERGYDVVRFDTIGIWESDGDISEYMMTQYLKDIESVIDFMTSQKSYEKILLGGHSRGGQHSLLYAAKSPKINLVLAIMPSSGPITGKRREEWEHSGLSVSQRDLPDHPNQKKEFRVPFTNVLDRDQYDAIGDMKKIQVPVILVAGGIDDIVPAEGVEKLFENANEPKKFILIPGIGHDYRFNPEEVVLVNERISEQLDSFGF